MKEHKTLRNYIENEELNIEKIVNDYSGYVYTIVQNLSKINLKQEDIEEIISDVFFILWKNYKKMGNDDKVTSYFAGVVKNLLRERARKAHYDVNLDDYREVIETKENIEEQFDNIDKLNVMEEILINMNKEDNDIFKLFYYSDKKIKEIAMILNISEFKVKSRLYRIRQKLRKKLEERGYRYGQ